MLDLPPRRHAVGSEQLWISLRDGVRLATTVLRPRGLERAPAVLMRTPYGTRNRANLLLPFAHLLAEAGYCVVVQDVRGRYASEGRFTPFVNEAEDGAQAIAWVVDQPFCDGRLGLVGFSYPGYAAWAALARAPAPVGALVVGLGASDLHAAHYPGGAFALETSLTWAARVGERESVAKRHLDLARGYAFRPILSADRVVLRERPWYRDWLAHPRRDHWWRGFLPDPPAAPPPTLLIGGWYDFFLGPQLADYAALSTAAQRAKTSPPRLVVGPWAHGPSAQRSWRARDAWLLRVATLETLNFLDRTLGDQGESPGDVGIRLYQLGAQRWIDVARWPLPEVDERALFLRSGGRANSSSGDGRLEPEPGAAGEAPDRFTYDPEDPVPSCAGPLYGPGGPADQRAVEARGDVLCYTGAALESDLDLVGPVRAVLFICSSAPDTDFTAKLVDVAPDGRATNLCEGVERCRWRESGPEPVWLEPDTTVRLEIDLWGTCCRLRAGHRLRLEVSSSNFPRFDRNENTREDPALARAGIAAQQTVLHDTDHPSQLVLPVLRA